MKEHETRPQAFYSIRSSDDKVRVNSSSLESPLTILADQSLEVVAVGKQILGPGESGGRPSG
jgi:hypothetical protein